MMELTTQTIDIPTSDDYPVRGDLYLPPTGEVRGIVLLCHGFKGFRTWGFFPYLATRLRDAGLAALALDMSHNGTLPASADAADGSYVRPDLFLRNTLARECGDLGHAIGFITGGGLSDEISGPLQIGLFGHSRGSVATTLSAIDYPEITVLATWSAIDDPDFYTRKQKERWREKGILEFVEAGGVSLGLGIDYLNDLEENHEKYFLRERMKDLNVPHLIAHGQADIVTGVEHAIRLHAAEGHLRHRELLVLQTGHTFGIPYPTPVPLSEPGAALERATDETVAWFERFLQEGIPR